MGIGLIIQDLENNIIDACKKKYNGESIHPSILRLVLEEILVSIKESEHVYIEHEQSLMNAPKTETKTDIIEPESTEEVLKDTAEV